MVPRECRIEYRAGCFVRRRVIMVDGGWGTLGGRYWVVMFGGGFSVVVNQVKLSLVVDIWWWCFIVCSFGAAEGIKRRKA